MDVTPYTEGFKAQRVKRMLGPPGISANALSKTAGVSQSQLSRWLSRAGSLPSVSETDEKKAESKRWTIDEKLRVLVAARGLTGEALGALLRREGVHQAQLMAWRDAAAGALGAEAAPSVGSKAARREVAEAKKQIKSLERELRRKDKALAEAAAMLFLEKKLQALGWHDRHQRQGKDADAKLDGESEK